MAHDAPKNSTCNIEGTTVLCGTIENLVKLELIKSEKGVSLFI